jgi:hypothetical protein
MKKLTKVVMELDFESFNLNKEKYQNSITKGKYQHIFKDLFKYNITITTNDITMIENLLSIGSKATTGLYYLISSHFGILHQSKKEFLDIVEIFLKNGANVNKTNLFKYVYHKNLLQLLIDYGLKLNKKYYHQPFNKLYFFEFEIFLTTNDYCNSDDFIDFLKILVNNGTDMHHRMNDYYDIICYYIKNSKKYNLKNLDKILKIFFEAGYEPKKQYLIWLYVGLYPKIDLSSLSTDFLLKII